MNLLWYFFLQKLVCGFIDLLIGCISSFEFLGGLKNAVLSAVDIGAKSFAMFLKSQRQWNSKPLSDTDAEKFRGLCEVNIEYVHHQLFPLTRVVVYICICL